MPEAQTAMMMQQFFCCLLPPKPQLGSHEQSWSEERQQGAERGCNLAVVTDKQRCIAVPCIRHSFYHVRLASGGLERLLE